MSGKNESNSVAPTPAPKLPAPSVSHVYVERGIGSGAIQKRAAR
jgi:hypothetical protein